MRKGYTSKEWLPEKNPTVNCCNSNPFLFKQVNFTNADYAKEPKHSFVSLPDYTTVYTGLYKLLLSVLLVFVMGILLFRNVKASVK
ncbi:hypothetical protein ACFSRY_18925 [Pontibacter locisalis]|uniref:Uncharacterized protein n=1 Tax=Pontibacter locisalis TaxID=1719035 RepID=A0ABW5IR73_9BACT